MTTLAREVAHEEQLNIWADEMLEAILDWLREEESYDDIVQRAEAVKRELRSIIETAFELAELHPPT
jgi:hypothetical protein